MSDTNDATTAGFTVVGDGDAVVLNGRWYFPAPSGAAATGSHGAPDWADELPSSNAVLLDLDVWWARMQPCPYSELAADRVLGAILDDVDTWTARLRRGADRTEADELADLAATVAIGAMEDLVRRGQQAYLLARRHAVTVLIQAAGYQHRIRLLDHRRSTPAALAFWADILGQP
jgi:hypothetical protein